MKAIKIKVAVCAALLAFMNFATAGCAPAGDAAGQQETAMAPQPQPSAAVTEGQIVMPAQQTSTLPESQPVMTESKPASPNAYLKIDENTQGMRENRQIPANSEHRYRIYQYMPESSRSQATESQLSDISKEVAGKVYYELKEDGEKNYSARVAVVAAVPLSDLKRDTEFGRVMAEYLLTDLADRGLKVTELRLGKEINIIAQTGEFILTQNIGELANIAPELDYVVVSTFSNTRKTLIIQGRLVSLQDGLVKSSWRYTMPLTRDLLAFFLAGNQPLTIAVRGMNN